MIRPRKKADHPGPKGELGPRWLATLLTLRVNTDMELSRGLPVRPSTL